MVHTLNYPNSEREFRNIQDELYKRTKKCIEEGNKPTFKGLLEIIQSETVIISAIHKLKANKGSNTPGSDGESLRSAFLEFEMDTTLSKVKDQFSNYKPGEVRRKWIPKPGRKEKRPLGIPNIEDRIIQECVRSVIEPILEAQFFKHSYGFRPMREASMAMERISDVTQKTNFHWIIEGDISKFFDNVNHTILIKKLYSMGIKDRRVLMIIKQMLKAGIMNEIKENRLGTPQGGIISPLLANVYLNSFDHWLSNQWETKKTRHQYSRIDVKYSSLKKTNLIPCFLVRYADDWVVATNSKECAEKLRWKIQKYLDEKLKLKLSMEKTKITNIRKRYITFLGFDYKKVKGRGKHGWISTSRPNLERLHVKMMEIKRGIYEIRKRDTLEKKVGDIILINSKIRGVLNYYDIATRVSVETKKYSRRLGFGAWNSLAPSGAKWIAANEVDNLKSVHDNYTTAIPTIEYGENKTKIGLTNVSFTKWRKPELKRVKETPYSEEGRRIYSVRTGKKSAKHRADELNNTEYARRNAIGSLKGSKLKYNFEYMMSRCYAFNRDKGKCRVCGDYLPPHQTNTHHINPKLPLELINRVNNLASMHIKCHELIHRNQNLDKLGSKTKHNVQKFRDKLNLNS
ncbi:group II intron reverse transcriptase/maturase [Bacillus sp. DJP31]|uniref:group II intron reverse transcriptase/maturase n=1 Tax=Bacillus sp. DJP31 TaxID=3409789 RepID=UPI003BB526A6